jgi:hypothetical protein
MRIIAGDCLNIMFVQARRFVSGVGCVLLTFVCSVLGVLYHLRVNVAEGDIGCVTRECTRRLGVYLRCVGIY